MNKQGVAVPSFGGIENHTVNLVNSLAALGNDVTYVSMFSNGAKLDPRVSKSVVPDLRIGWSGLVSWNLRHGVQTLVGFKKVALELDLDRFDVVHVHDGLMALLIQALGCNLKTVFTLHAPSPWEFNYGSHESLRRLGYRTVYVEGARRVNAVIAVSTAIMWDLVRRWGVPQERVHHVPNAVDARTLYAPQRRQRIEEVVERYGIQEPYFVFVGRLVREKGLDVLLRSLKRHVTSEIRCVIVGEGPLRHQLQEQAVLEGLSTKVKFLGYVPLADLPALYSGARFFVLPSTVEGMPTALLEAMATGTAVIATSVSGTVDAVRDGYNGMLVRPGDIESLGERMQFLAENAGLAMQMGRNARRFVEQNYDWSVIARKVLAIYEDLSSS